MATVPHIIIAGGGTGGHLYPALAIVEYLRDHFPDVSCEFFCTNKEVDRSILEKNGQRYTSQPVRPFTKHPLKIPGFLRAWRASRLLCRKYFSTRRPTAILGTGGYGSGPAVVTGSQMGIPCYLLNPDAVPGRANRHLARQVRAIFCQWESSRQYFSQPDCVQVVGCPLRSELFSPTTGTEHEIFGLQPDRKTLMITGASLGARSINAAIELLIPEFRQFSEWQFIHICGADDVEQLQLAYQAAGLTAWVGAFTHQMPAVLKLADLAIARAGAVTVAELTATCTPAIYLPYPYHRDQHQKYNAQMICEAGGGLLLEDTRETNGNAAQLRTTLLPLMSNEQALSRRRDALRQLPPNRAAETIAQQLLI
ncbi:MAG: UDP-N-acetylglucosamine--N-acetylmuramyl-(pentapeptide) pyrophosphoryl-undecaprenol N-acetylglucosamine transferase [Phycisphaerae bacterium]|nr:UDP-N-acetylglucosamine--N-acetylmuramyl-(pentapeptide) pyrophosphoryl-undecaprenol N-acetylglucosamine transferase [Phycisphaerae bacterium]